MEPEPYELPMFPLGRPLFPAMVLPLHVFESRYRALMEHLVAAEETDGAVPELGVVLIERGSEVGGGEVRSRVGTAARVVQARRFGDGRWAVVVVGHRRVRVAEWLSDDPWPRALVGDWPDPEPVEPDGALDARYDEVVGVLRRVLALASELGAEGADATVELSDDPVIGSYQIASFGPFGPLDHQRLLAARTVTERLEVAHEELSAQRRLLEQGLLLDDPGPDPPAPSGG